MRAAVSDCRGGAEPLRLTVVPTLAGRWLTPRLPGYHRMPDAVPVRLDVSAELRPRETFDVALRTGLGNWSGFEAIPLMPVEVTRRCSVRPWLPRSSCRSQLILLRCRCSRTRIGRNGSAEAGAEHLNLRFYADDYSTHELDAAAAIESTGVALLSPILFAPLVSEGKLVQPFQHVMRGPNWHYVLLDPRETSATGAWLLRLVGARGAWRNSSTEITSSRMHDALCRLTGMAAATRLKKIPALLAGRQQCLVCLAPVGAGCEASSFW